MNMREYTRTVEKMPPMLANIFTLAAPLGLEAESARDFVKYFDMLLPPDIELPDESIKEFQAEQTKVYLSRVHVQEESSHTPGLRHCTESILLSSFAGTAVMRCRGSVSPQTVPAWLEVGIRQQHETPSHPGRIGPVNVSGGFINEVDNTKMLFTVEGYTGRALNLAATTLELLAWRSDECEVLRFLTTES